MIGVDAKKLETVERKITALLISEGIVTEDFFGDITLRFRAGGYFGMDRRETSRRERILTKKDLGFGNGESTG